MDHYFDWYDMSDERITFKPAAMTLDLLEFNESLIWSHTRWGRVLFTSEVLMGYHTGSSTHISVLSSSCHIGTILALILSPNCLWVSLLYWRIM